MYDQHAPESESVTLYEKIPNPYLSLLLSQTMEIHIILDREPAFFEPFQQLSTESVDGALDVFIGKGDVHVSGTAYQICEMGKAL